MVEDNPAITSTPILDFVRKSMQKERKRYRAPRSLSLQCFAFETLPSTILILNLFCGCVNTFFYCLVQALKKITKKTEKIIAITIVKIFLHLFFAHTTYYTSNTIFCRTNFLKTVQVIRYLQTIHYNGVTTDDHITSPKVYAGFNSTSSFFVLPIQGSGIICLSQSCIDGINPKSSATCCSPTQRVGIFLPLDNMIV
jgi:hypothetical protein